MTLLLRIDWSPDASTASIIDIAAHQALAEATEPHPPTGGVHDADRWLRSATSASRAALESLVVIGPSASDIRLVEVGTVAPGGLVALDADGTPLHDALLGTHTESAADGDWLVRHTEGGADAWIEATGVPPTAGSTAALLSYLHRSDAAAWDAMARCTLPIGLLAERLGARPALGAADAAGTAVADRRTPQAWCVDLLRIVDGDRDWSATLPPIVDTAAPVGMLDPAIGDALGLPPDRPLHLGPLPRG